MGRSRSMQRRGYKFIWDKLISGKKLSKIDYFVDTNSTNGILLVLD
jgi:hypothetical protein